jgi:hypothetical protein
VTTAEKPKRTRTRTPRPPKAAALEAPPTETLAPAPPVHKPRVRKPKVVAPVAPVVPAIDLVPTADPGTALAMLASLPAPVSGDLSLDQQHDRYAFLKKAVAFGVGSFIWMGSALEEIRDQQYYRIDGHGSFDDFVQAEWDLNGKSRASQLIRASAVYRAVAKFATDHGLDIPLPAVEFHCAELARLDSPEKQAAAWQEVVATAPRKRDRLHITGEFVKGIVQENLGFLPPPNVGPGTPNPTPPTKPKETEPVPPTAVTPEDEVPPESATPEGPAPDTLEGYVPVMEAEVVKQGGKAEQITPVYALKYLIRALKGGFMYKGDPLVLSLAEVVQEGIVSWYDAPDGVVEVDYDEGEIPEFVAVPATEPAQDEEVVA